MGLENTGRSCPAAPVSQTEASASVWRGGAIERTQASAASFGNRGCAAREICPDDASGGPVSFCPPSGDRYCFSYPRAPRRRGPCRIGIPHQALRASCLAAAHSAREGPALGRVRTSVRRGSDVPPARHSLPRPCFAAPRGRPGCGPPRVRFPPVRFPPRFLPPKKSTALRISPQGNLLICAIPVRPLRPSWPSWRRAPLPSGPFPPPRPQRRSCPRPRER